MELSPLNWTKLVIYIYMYKWYVHMTFNDVALVPHCGAISTNQRCVMPANLKLLSTPYTELCRSASLLRPACVSTSNNSQPISFYSGTLRLGVL